MIVSGIDWETTGFFEPAHRIIEACIIRYNLNLKPDAKDTTWAEIDRYVQRINPGRAIDKKARDVHGISESDLIGKPDFKAVAPEIHRLLDSSELVVAHNGLDFDFPFVIQEFERVGHPLPDFIPFDTMMEGRWATPMGMVPNLGGLCFSCGVTYDKTKAHAAEYDVERMMECFFFGIRRGVFKVTV